MSTAPGHQVPFDRGDGDVGHQVPFHGGDGDVGDRDGNVGDGDGDVGDGDGDVGHQVPFDAGDRDGVVCGDVGDGGVCVILVMAMVMVMFDGYIFTRASSSLGVLVE